jgi:hypothetical protein
MVPTVVMALIKKEFMLLWRGSASPVTIGMAAEERELEDLEGGAASKKARSEVYEPVSRADPDSDEGRVSTAVYTIDDESDDDNTHHTQ